ncbi:MAG TPA: DUF3035 domain-containing protein [Stellaceae bacterium]|nr:DUF3035 domain-containing protein [Stellaceae bacterium]
MGTRYVLPALALGALALSLGGCTDIKRAIGMEKVIPDEFAVVSRAPLAIPPDYSLRPPQPGAAPTQETPTQERAKEAIFRVGQNQAGLPPAAAQRTPGEDDLLRQAGVQNADPKIRAVVTEEQQAAPEGEKTFVDKLLFWRKTGTTAEVIDPAKEADRIKQAQTAGQPVAPDAAGASAQAETPAPTIERKKSTSFLNLF